MPISTPHATEDTAAWHANIDFESLASKQIYALSRSQIDASTLPTNESRRIRSMVDVEPDKLPDTRAFVRSLCEIFSASVPESWKSEGHEPPSEFCRNQAASVLAHIHGVLNILPSRVGVSREGGIMLLYRHPFAGKELEMEIEIDNDLEAVGVISTQRDVLQSAELGGPDDWQQFARNFRDGASLQA